MRCTWYPRLETHSWIAWLRLRSQSLSMGIYLETDDCALLSSQGLSQSIGGEIVAKAWPVHWQCKRLGQRENQMLNFIWFLDCENKVANPWKVFCFCLGIGCFAGSLAEFRCKAHRAVGNGARLCRRDKMCISSVPRRDIGSSSLIMNLFFVRERFHFPRDIE